MSATKENSVDSFRYPSQKRGDQHVPSQADTFAEADCLGPRTLLPHFIFPQSARNNYSSAEIVFHWFVFRVLAA